MVRINIVSPSSLSDQHLVAEYREILLLLGYLRVHPEISSDGAHFLKNPIRYFGDKLSYLKKRHSLLRAEMKRRGFHARIVPKMSAYSRKRFASFSPTSSQLAEIKARIINRLRHPPRKNFYRYYGEQKPTAFLVSKIKKAKFE